MGNLTAKIFLLLKSMWASPDCHPFFIPFLLPSFPFRQLAVTEHTAGSEVCTYMQHHLLHWHEVRKGILWLLWKKHPWICCRRTTSWCKTVRHFSFQHFAIVLRGRKEGLSRWWDRQSIIPYVQFWPLVFIIITRKTSVKKCIAAKNRQMVMKHKAEVTRG